MKRTLRSSTRNSGVAAKHRRIQQQQQDDSEASEGSPPRSLLMTILSQELRIHILQFLAGSQLADFSCVSKQCREDANHPASPQDRWGTLFVRPNTPVVNILQTLGDAQDRGVFRRIQCLKVVYPEREGMETATVAQARDVLKSVTKLRTVTRFELWVPRHPQTDRRAFVPNCISSFLSQIMPNLQHVNICASVNQFSASNFAKNCRSLKSFRWENEGIEIHIDGREFKQCRNLTDLDLDNSMFQATTQDWQFPDSINLLAPVQRTVERLSLKDVKGWFWGQPHTVTALIPQQTLIKFVRGAPRLCWFRSDLTPDNVTMLQAERPNITFVTT